MLHSLSKSLIALLIAFSLSAAPLLRAEDPPPNAKEVLEKMSAFYTGVKSIKVKAATTMKMNMQGMDMDMNGKSSIAAQRPNKFSSVSKGEGMAAMALSNTFISDGAKTFIYMPMMQNYTESEATSDFSGLVGVPGGGSGAEAFIIGLLSAGVPGASLFDGADDAKYIALEDLSGVKCHHLQLATSNPGLDTMGMGSMTLDIWVEAGGKPLLRKVNPNFGDMLSKLAGSGATAALTPDAKTCQANLIKIDGLKKQYALEHSSKEGDKISAPDLEKTLNTSLPKCPSGQAYVLNPVGQDPLCLSGIEGHDLKSAAEARSLEGVEGLEGLGDVGDMLKDMKMEMSYEFSDWEINPEIAADVFTFTPPEGAKKSDELFGGFDMNAGGDGSGIDGFGASEDEDPAKQLEGKPAPAFNLKLAGGGDFDLAAQKGKKIVILDFWATWCVPCKKSMPVLIKVAEDYAGKGVAFVPVNLEEPEADVLEFIKNEKWNVKVALDADYAVGALYMAEAIPLTVVIGKDGNVAMIHVGAAEGFDAQLRAKLDELLATK